MSTTTITRTFALGGVPTNPASVVLCDPAGTYGVKRADTDAVVVAHDTAMTNASPGVYTHTFTDPAAGLTYVYWVKVVIQGLTRYRQYQHVATGDLVSIQAMLDPLVIPFVPAPLPMAHVQELNTFVEFCGATEVWEHTYETVTVADQAPYPLVLPANTTLWQAKDVLVNGTYRPVLEDVEPGDESITLKYPYSASGETLKIKVVVFPKPGCTMAPQWLMDRFGPGIADGVIGALKAMAQKPWTDMDGAAQHLAGYASAIASARVEVLEHRQGSARLTIPKFV
jgi:hypothetical protein